MAAVKLSSYYLPTRKEDPREAEIPSHRLMIRAGMIRRLSQGLYSYLPLANRVLQKIKTIVREEMNEAGAQEVLMPIMQPREIWEETGRWDVYGPEMLRLEDRHEREYGLGPTHEEVITDLVAEEINSYRDCPQIFYQVATKFRDEIRPRFGIMRSREFIMKDAYSFDASEEGAVESYELMDETYQKIFDRIGLNYRKVQAATGAIGGSRSHEFMVTADTGEDTVLHCPECGYAANQEQAEGDVRMDDGTTGGADEGEPEKFETPGVESIEDLMEIDSEAEPERQIKTMVMEVGDTPTALLVPGNYQLNETKLGQQADGSVAELTAGEIKELFGAHPGSLGAVNIDDGIRVWADPSLKGRRGLYTGANEDGYHLRGVDVERDIDVDRWVDLRVVEPGDLCSECGSPLEEQRGIEVGHIFYLGTKYSEALDADVQTESGGGEPMIMGCYGIGISRIIGAAIEQGHDDQGIIWPPSIAPFHVYVLMTSPDDERQQSVAAELSSELEEHGLDVVIDDRDETVGYKFNESELIGIPWRITLGRDLDDDCVELTVRETGDTDVVPIDQVVDDILGEVPDHVRTLRA